MTLTRIRLRNIIYKAHPNLSREKTKEAVEALFGIIMSSLGNGEDVLITGFGKFCVRQKKARRARNPQTGEEVMLEPRRVVTFRPSGKLREKINSASRP